MTTNSQRTSKRPSLALWLKKLPQSPLAIDFHVAKRTRWLLNDDDCSNDKLADAMKQDPVLCLKLFQFTDKRVQKKDGEIQSLMHLISLTGLNLIGDTLQNAKTTEKHPDGLQELLSTSLFAAQLSGELMGEKFRCSKQRFFLPALFFNAPLWLIWSAAPKIMSQGQLLASRRNKSYIHLSEKHLGFSLTELLKHSGKYIHLPHSTQKALAINPKEDIKLWAKLHHYNKKQLSALFSDDKQLLHYFFSIEMGIYLINQYALAIYLDWGGKHRQRYEKLLCRYLKLSRSAFRKQVKNSH